MLTFLKKLYQIDQSTANLLNRIHLDHESNTKIKKLSHSDAQKLHLLRYYVSSHNTLVLEEKLQNVNNSTKQTIIHLLKNIPSKMVTELTISRDIKETV